MIDQHRILAVAADLLGDPRDQAENPNDEYRRAIVQMSTDLLGLSSDYSEQVAAGIDATAALNDLDDLIRKAQREVEG